MINDIKQIIIWGSGKIGRGFIADLYSNAGYKICFVDADLSLVKKLKDKGEYSLCHMYWDGSQKNSVINSFDVLHIDEKEKLSHAINNAEVMSISVFPQHFDIVAKDLSELIRKRVENNIERSLNILLCSNIFEPVRKLDSLIRSYLADDCVAYYEKYIGLVECIVIRMAVPPTQEQISKDELVVVTNGYPELIVDKVAWKGKLPCISGIRMTDDIIAYESKKFFTYNMLHCLYSYIGSNKGLKYVYDCTQDAQVQYIAEQAIDEVLAALKISYSFDDEDLEEWKKHVFQNMANKSLYDELERVGADPVRKLARQDRLTGAALLCVQNGIFPYYLTKAIASGILYCNERDAKSLEIAKYITKYGLRDTVIEYCGLSREPELVQMICEECDSILVNKLFDVNQSVVDLIKKTYSKGFEMEKTYRGCGQCMLLTLFDITNTSDDALFQVSSGLSGGMGLCGDGACGGYIGGILFMGKYAGRRKHQMLLDGDKEEQYLSYEMSQDLHDLIKETYGDVVCKNIHTKIFGQDFCLRTKPVRDAFEEAGAHTYKCTGVIAMIATFVIRIMIKNDFIKV